MKPFENYIQYLKRLQSNYEVGTGQHNVLGIAINEAEVALRQFAVIKSVCEHDYMQRGGAVKYYRCVKCGNEKI